MYDSSAWQSTSKPDAVATSGGQLQGAEAQRENDASPVRVRRDLSLAHHRVVQDRLCSPGGVLRVNKAQIRLDHAAADARLGVKGCSGVKPSDSTRSRAAQNSEAGNAPTCVSVPAALQLSPAPV